LLSLGPGPANINTLETFWKDRFCIKQDAQCKHTFIQKQNDSNGVGKAQYEYTLRRREKGPIVVKDSLRTNERYNSLFTLFRRRFRIWIVRFSHSGTGLWFLQGGLDSNCVCLDRECCLHSRHRCYWVVGTTYVRGAKELEL